METYSLLHTTHIWNIEILNNKVFARILTINGRRSNGCDLNRVQRTRLARSYSSLLSSYLGSGRLQRFPFVEIRI